MKITKPFSRGVFTGQDTNPGAIARAFQSISDVLQDLHLAVVSNLTFGDNVIGGFQTVTLTTSPTYTGGSFNPIVLPWAFASKKAPQSVIVGQIIVPSNQPKLLSAQSVQWTYNSVNQTVNVSYISGLNNGSTYTITLEVK